jgi:hypothetical protein
MRVLDAVENHHEIARGGTVEIGVLPGGAHGEDSLVGAEAGETVESRARLEADGDVGAAREVDDLLDARAAGALGDEDTVEGPLGLEGFKNGVDSAENGHSGGLWC